MEVFSPQKVLNDGFVILRQFWFCVSEKDKGQGWSASLDPSMIENRLCIPLQWEEKQQKVSYRTGTHTLSINRNHLVIVQHSI